MIFTPVALHCSPQPPAVLSGILPPELNPKFYHLSDMYSASTVWTK